MKENLRNQTKNQQQNYNDSRLLGILLRRLESLGNDSVPTIQTSLWRRSSVVGRFLSNRCMLPNKASILKLAVTPVVVLLSLFIYSKAFCTSYSISYHDGVVNNMPTDVSSRTADTSVELSSNIPTLTGYYFMGWCLGTSNSSNITTTNGTDSCSGTSYGAGSLLPVTQSSNNSNYLYAMWTDKPEIEFTFDANVSSIVLDGNTITQSGTKLLLPQGETYAMQINLNSGYMISNVSVVSGNTTTSGSTITVGSSNSAINITSQPAQNVNVLFTFSNTTSITVDGQTISTSGESISLMGGSTYTVAVTPSSNYKLSTAAITSGDWYSISNINTTNNTFDLTVGSNAGAVTISNAQCITADTLITLADNSKKRVADLTGDEELLVWDFDTASYSSAPIVFIEPEPEAYYSIIHLFFDNKTDVEISYEHGFFDYTLGKFIYINYDNPEQYIGHQFIMQDGDTYKPVTLTDIKYETKYTSLYGLTTYKHFNFFNNDMLSIEGNITGMFNYFDVDKTTMGYDQGKKQADIAKYGLLNYEDLSGIIDELGFEAYNGQYLNISVGKGLTTWEGIKALADYYGHFTADNHERRSK